MRFRTPAQHPDTLSEPDRLRWLLHKVAANDRAAFAELFARCSGNVLHDLRRTVTDPDRMVSVFAATFMEVWWLAGCYTNPTPDVVVWIDGIVRRRLAEPWTPAGGVLAEAERELAGLLRPQPSTTAQTHDHQERQRYEENPQLMGLNPGDHAFPFHRPDLPPR